MLDCLALSLSVRSSQSGLGEAFWELVGSEAVAHILFAAHRYGLAHPHGWCLLLLINHDALLALCLHLNAERRS